MIPPRPVMSSLKIASRRTNVAITDQAASTTAQSTRSAASRITGLATRVVCLSRREHHGPVHQERGEPDHGAGDAKDKRHALGGAHVQYIAALPVHVRGFAAASRPATAR